MTTNTLTEGLQLDYRPDTYWMKEGKAKSVGVRKHSGHGGMGPGADGGGGPIGSMVGSVEYLPEDAAEEVEIARVMLASTTWDVISVRARPVKGKIWYRIVDEYDSPWEDPVTCSKEPLTLGKFIDLIDRCDDDSGFGLGLLEPCWNSGLQYTDDPESVADMIQIESRFYPQIQTWFERKIESFFAEYREDVEA